jgi:hypothetical protein
MKAYSGKYKSGKLIGQLQNLFIRAQIRPYGYNCPHSSLPRALQSSLEVLYFIQMCMGVDEFQERALPL